MTAPAAPTPPRSLPPGQARRLEALRATARLLDSAFAVPGTRYRVGLDPLCGLVPVVGDLVSPVFTISLLWQARDLGVPRVVQMRMILNVAIDAGVGVVPVLGDLFDVAWKANNRNMALLERHARDDRPAGLADWLFVGAAIVVVLAIAAVPVLLAIWLLSVLRGLIA